MPRPRKRRTYGEGSVYQRASDSRWVGTVEAGYTETGARRRLTVTAKTEAEAKRRLKERRRQLEAEGSPVTGRTTVKAWADQWLEITARTSRPKTHVTDKGAVSKWIVPTIGHKRLDQLTPADVRAVAAAIRAGNNSTSTLRRYHGVLIRLLKAAIQEGHNVPSRVIAVEAPAPSVTDRQALRTDQAILMLATATQTHPNVSRWGAALLQGMRRAEALGLTWPAVNLDANTLTVSWQLQALPYVDKRDHAKGFRVPDGYEARQLRASLHLVRPKSRAGWRVIPLVPWMSDALAVWREIAPPSPHGLVWPGPDGGPADTRDDFQEWLDLQAEAGVAHPSGRPYFLHEARHTTATLLMELGVPESVRIAIMGHSSIAVTRGYEYASQDEARKALAAVAERLGLAAVGESPVSLPRSLEDAGGLLG